VREIVGDVQGGGEDYWGGFVRGRRPRCMMLIKGRREAVYQCRIERVGRREGGEGMGDVHGLPGRLLGWMLLVYYSIVRSTF